MPNQFALHPTQLKDLDAIRSLGPEGIKEIVIAIESLSDPLLRPLDLKEVIKGALPDDENNVDRIVRQILYLYDFKRKEGISVDNLIERLSFGLADADSPWPESKLSEWNHLRPELKLLFSLSEINSVVKALNLSYDYDNLLQNVKIVTDVRPIYDDPGNHFVGAVVSHTLRLIFETLDGTKSIRITIDNEDIRELQKACDRALRKADIAKKFMKEKGSIQTFICGEED